MSRLVSEKFPAIFSSALKDFNLGGITHQGVFNAIRHACLELDEALPKRKVGGTTFAAVFQCSLGLFVINVGDSRVVLDVEGKGTLYTEDQRADEPYFQKKVRKLGADIICYNGISRVIPSKCMITRDLGNHPFRIDGHKILIPVPEITFIRPDQIVKGDSYVLIGSDGFFDHVTTRQAVKAFRSRLNSPLETVVKELVSACYHNGCNDDTTLTIVPL